MEHSHYVIFNPIYSSATERRYNNSQIIDNEALTLKARPSFIKNVTLRRALASKTCFTERDLAGSRRSSKLLRSFSKHGRSQEA